MKQISRKHRLLKTNQSKLLWWMPLWKGLVFDVTGKHQKNIGSSLWLYLYLLFSVNRKTGIVKKKQKMIADEIGFSLRTVQNQLAKLKSHRYISIQNKTIPLEIHISKYKLFNHKQFNDQETENLKTK